MRNMDQSDRSVGMDSLSIFHPNNPPLLLGMLVGCVAMDTSSVVTIEVGMDTS